MKIIWCSFYILFIFIKIISCQDDDYEAEPDEVTNEFMSSDQPEFFKNAFTEGESSSGRQSSLPASYSNDLWAPYLRYFPFSNIDAKSISPYYSPFYSPYSGPSIPFNGGNKETGRAIKGFHDKVKRRPDFFNSDFDFNSPKSNEFDDSKPKSLEPANQEHNHKPMTFNNYNSLPFSPQLNSNAYSALGRFNAYQNGLQSPHMGMPQPPPHHPVGSHLFPYTQQGRQKDNFDEELKKLGIDLDEYLGEGSNGDKESNKKEKNKRKKKDKKVKPIAPTIIPFRQVTTTENPTQHQLLKSHVENDILNFGNFYF